MKANPLVLKSIAGGVLLAGAAAAYSVAQVPAKRSDLSTVRALSSRLQSQAPAPETGLSVPELAPGEAPKPAGVKAPVKIKQNPVPAPRPSAKPAPAPVVAAKPPVTPPAPPAAPESPVKNIALVGVTHADERDMAWLVDTSSNERESATEGGRAFGFTIKQVEDDSVILARGGQDYTVRLGEKQVYVASAEPIGADPTFSGEFGQGGRRQRGEGGGRNRGQFGGFGQNGGGRSFGGNRGSGGGESAIVFGGNNGGGNFGGNRGSFQSSNRGGNRGSGGGGFSGGGGGGGGFNRQQGSANPFSSASTNATASSNPQTARRTGGSFSGGIGGTTQAPTAITNPQTQRRLGSTSASQPAFGQAQQQSGGFGQNRGVQGMRQR